VSHQTGRWAIALVVLLVVCLPSSTAPAESELRISNLSIFLNDFDVTVQGVLLGAVPSMLSESLHSGVSRARALRGGALAQRFRNRLPALAHDRAP
jgi:hypothetical protein